MFIQFVWVQQPRLDAVENDVDLLEYTKTEVYIILKMGAFMMRIQKKYPLLLAGLVTVMLLISACSQTGSGGSNLSPLQVVQNSVTKMKDVKSSHVDIKSTDSIQVAGASITSATGTPTPTNLNATITGSGDQALPDQQLTVNANGINLTEIVKGDKVYVKNPQGKWYVLNKSDYDSFLPSNPIAGMTIDQNTLLAALATLQINDHGDQNLNGQSLRHITASLDKNAVKQLVNSDPQIKSLFGSQDIDSVLNNAKTFQATVDVWIDETQFYLHRIELKLNTAGNVATATSGTVSNASTNVDVTVDMSKFNTPVTITAPDNATPTTNPADIFGMTTQP